MHPARDQQTQIRDPVRATAKREPPAPRPSPPDKFRGKAGHRRLISVPWRRRSRCANTRRDKPARPVADAPAPRGRDPGVGFAPTPRHPIRNQSLPGCAGCRPQHRARCAGRRRPQCAPAIRRLGIAHRDNCPPRRRANRNAAARSARGRNGRDTSVRPLRFRSKGAWSFPAPYFKQRTTARLQGNIHAVFQHGHARFVYPCAFQRHRANSSSNCERSGR